MDMADVIVAIHGRGVTVSADADAERVFAGQVPAGRRPAVGIGDELQQPRIAGRAGMGAAGPFAVDFAVTVGAVGRLGRVGVRTDPGVVRVIRGRHRLETQFHAGGRWEGRGDAVAGTGRRDALAPARRGAETKTAVAIGEHGGSLTLPANLSASDGAVRVGNAPPDGRSAGVVGPTQEERSDEDSDEQHQGETVSSHGANPGEPRA